MKIFKTESLLNSKPPKETYLLISSTRVLSESASLGSHFRENLQLFCHASGLISLPQSLIESNTLNFMMKWHFDILPIPNLR